MAAQQPEKRRKATEVVQQDERQASKAAAVEDEASGDESMQDLNAANADMRNKRWDFSKRSDRNEVRERVDQDKPVMMIGPEIYPALRNTAATKKRRSDRKYSKTL